MAPCMQNASPHRPTLVARPHHASPTPDLHPYQCQVRNPQFYEALLDVASHLDVESVDPKTVAALYR